MRAASGFKDGEYPPWEKFFDLDFFIIIDGIRYTVKEVHGKQKTIDTYKRGCQICYGGYTDIVQHGEARVWAKGKNNKTDCLLFFNEYHLGEWLRWWATGSLMKVISSAASLDSLSESILNYFRIDDFDTLELCCGTGIYEILPRYTKTIRRDTRGKGLRIRKGNDGIFYFELRIKCE